jgi:hypothetical protein
MPDDELNAGQRWAMLALMALDGEATNPVLEDEVGFTITGKDRAALNSRDLVTSTLDGPHRSYRHVLTEDGWAWCEAQLSADRPDGSNPAGRTLYAVLHMWHRYLKNADLTLLECSQRAAAPSHSPTMAVGEPVDLTEEIRLVYRKLAERPGDWVSLTRLRPLLPPAERSDVDDTLQRMNRSPGVHIVPESNQKALTAADRRAAVRIGGEDSHIIAIEDA